MISTKIMMVTIFVVVSKPSLMTMSSILCFKIGTEEETDTWNTFSVKSGSVKPVPQRDWVPKRLQNTTRILYNLFTPHNLDVKNFLILYVFKAHVTYVIPIYSKVFQKQCLPTHTYWRHSTNISFEKRKIFNSIKTINS